MGTPESIRHITPADALTFHKERYRPKDAYILIYGPVTKEEAVEQIENHLTNLVQPVPVERGFLAPLPEQPEKKLSWGFPELRQDKILVVGQAAPPAGFSRRKLWFSLLLLEDVLNSAQPGGLSKPLYYDDFIVADISTRLFLLPSGDIGFEVFFSPEDGVSIPESAKRVREVLRDLVQNGLPTETFDAIQNQTRAEVQRLEKAQARYHATIAQSSILNLGQALDVKAYHHELGQSTVDDLNAILKSIVESTYTTTAHAHPEKPQ
jgi:predicted Zn-dependent peptidase